MNEKCRDREERERELICKQNANRADRNCGTPNIFLYVNINEGGERGDSFFFKGEA